MPIKDFSRIMKIISFDKYILIHKKLSKVMEQKGYKCIECGVEPNSIIYYKHRGHTSTSKYIVYQDNETFQVFTIDHIIPIFKGGTSDMINLQVMCEKCNLKKGINVEWNKNTLLLILYYKLRNYLELFRSKIRKIQKIT